MSKKIYSTLLGLTVLSLTACQPTIAVDKSSSNIIKSKDNKIIINNIPLSYKISIDGYNSRFINDLLEASVKISNQDATQYALEYKFKWYDETGFETGTSLSIWKPIILDASDNIEVNALAMTPEVETFKFYIRGKQ